ncbi:MAG: hypothetical protein P8013_09335 [Candidatus Sulfobium sp.]
MKAAEEAIRLYISSFGLGRNEVGHGHGADGYFMSIEEVFHSW